MKYILSLILALWMILVPTLVSADTYNNYLKITILNNGTSVYTNLPLLVSINNTQLANLGYINSTGLDTNVLEGATARDFSVIADRLGIDAQSYGAGQKRTFYYRMDNVPEQSSYSMIFGLGGNLTTTDSSSIELGNNFRITISAFFDTTAGSNKNICIKASAFKIWISGSQAITAGIYNGGGWATNVTTTGVTSGAYIIVVLADVQSLYLYINGILRDTKSLNNGVISVPDTAGGIVWDQNNVMIYTDYITVEVD
jgi:hypothetical protein